MYEGYSEGGEDFRAEYVTENGTENGVDHGRRENSILHVRVWISCV